MKQILSYIYAHYYHLLFKVARGNVHETVLLLLSFILFSFSFSFFVKTTVFLIGKNYPLLFFIFLSIYAISIRYFIARYFFTERFIVASVKQYQNENIYKRILGCFFVSVLFLFAPLIGLWILTKLRSNIFYQFFYWWVSYYHQ